MTYSRIGVLVLVAAMLGTTPVATLAGAEPKPKRDPIYKSDVKAADAIAAALERAKRDNRRVLLQFGADWCGWCHRLHALFREDQDIKRALDFEYELVLVDTDKGQSADVVERYGNPTKLGLPVLVVLDADGKQLVTQETGSLEEGDHHDPAKVLAFLKQNVASPLNAREVLAAALAEAAATKRKAFVYFSAPWCAWCHRMDDFLHDPKVAGVIRKAFVPVKIDVDRMTHGKEISTQYEPTGKAGLPYFVIADANGEKLTDSVGDNGNVGFPVAPEEIAHFMEIIRRHGAGLDDQALASLKESIEAAKPTKTSG